LVSGPELKHEISDYETGVPTTAIISVKAVKVTTPSEGFRNNALCIPVLQAEPLVPSDILLSFVFKRLCLIQEQKFDVKT
jgi:hypothetical protein